MEMKWHKSSYSEHSDGNCLELASSQDGILLRESDEPGVIISTTPATLRTLVSGTKAGEFDGLV